MSTVEDTNDDEVEHTQIQDFFGINETQVEEEEEGMDEDGLDETLVEEEEEEEENVTVIEESIIEDDEEKVEDDSTRKRMREIDDTQPESSGIIVEPPKRTKIDYLQFLPEPPQKNWQWNEKGELLDVVNQIDYGTGMEPAFICSVNVDVERYHIIINIRDSNCAVDGKNRLRIRKREIKNSEYANLLFTWYIKGWAKLASLDPIHFLWKNNLTDKFNALPQHENFRWIINHFEAQLRSMDGEVVASLDYGFPKFSICVFRRKGRVIPCMEWITYMDPNFTRIILAEYAQEYGWPKLI